MWVYVDCWSALAYLLLLAGFIFTVLCVFLYATSSRIPLIIRYSEEFNFKDPSQPGQIFQYPHLGDEPSIELSVIVPAYEEEKRLPPMLDECLEYLQAREKRDPNFTYEVIIVDDGSRDRTTSVGLQYSLKYGTENVRVLTLAKNRGKGGAVRLGMLSARGKLLLFADADGATKFSDVDKLEEVANELLKQSTNVVVVGSRAHLEKESIAERSIFRTVLMYGFHFLVWLFTVRGIADTQCGFKLFSREAATHLFTSLHVERWAFDVEILYIAQALKFPVAEVAVRWTEIEGSKVVPVWTWIEMGRDLFLIWLRYKIGAWSIAAQPNKLK
uniref:Dolichyl-phosphate beta-glucosyltransferase n=1 Tax=Rhipicephalus microplus TaxID=6941 RepID=A0A6M2CMF4_RHIMP